MLPPRCQVLLQILLAILAVGLPCIVAICLVLGVRGNSVEVVLVEAAVLLVAIVPIANQAHMHVGIGVCMHVHVHVPIANQAHARTCICGTCIHACRCMCSACVVHV